MPKIKRDFTQNEAVQSLLKIVQSLEVEVGIQKSELAEAYHKLHRVEIEGTKTKKSWLKDELVAQMDIEIKSAQKNSTAANKLMNEWRNKYFSLIATKPNRTP